MSANKKTFKKSPYGNSKYFTNTELLAIITKHKEDKTKDKKSPMGFDTTNETQSETMKKNNQRYLTIMMTDLEGKSRPLNRDIAPTVTGSKVNIPEAKDGKIASSGSFSTTIDISIATGDEITMAQAKELLAPVDDDEWAERVEEFKIGSTFTVTPKFVDAVLKVATEVVVDEKFPDISDDQRDEKVKRQMELLRDQYNQWRVESWISEEFERLLNDKKIRKDIKWIMGEKQSIQGNVQRGRKPRTNDDKSMNVEDEAILEKLSEVAGKDVNSIPLDKARVHKKIRIDGKDGSLWCKIYDRLGTTTVGGKKVRKLATMKNPDTGKIEVLNNKTVTEWLRYGSVFTGSSKYQLCITESAGARLHESVPEMEARRGAKGEAGSKIDEENASALDDFGGNFAGAEEDDDEDTPAPAPKKKGELTAVEKQMQALDDEANDDE